ncbi:MAG: hypothetical protein CL912_33820 [Deltaproteobacteria bacterium]|nr:hypothetical protein [Deltaproteobacteria bacterium]
MRIFWVFLQSREGREKLRVHPYHLILKLNDNWPKYILIQFSKREVWTVQSLPVTDLNASLSSTLLSDSLTKYTCAKLPKG